MSRRLVTLALVLCLMFLVSTTNPLITSEFSTDEENTQATSGRSLHYGDWVAHRETPIDFGCGGFTYGSLIDLSNDGMIAAYAGRCSKGPSNVSIYDSVDLLLLESFETNYELDFLQFSPDGDLLALASPGNVKIYSTSDWEVLLDETMTDFFISDMTWSGESDRLVVATGNNGGHMYEGPDWDEVDGTTSNGGLVTHDPTEDKLWYLNSDGTGNVYEYQNVPLAGYQWVMTRSFTVSCTSSCNEMLSSPDGNEILVSDYYGTYVYSVSDYSQGESFSGTNPLFSFDGSTMLLLNNDYYQDNVVLISTNGWSVESDFVAKNSGWDSITISSNDSEIFHMTKVSSNVVLLTGYMPDSDGDGVVDYRDLCSGTDAQEDSDSAGCAPSQRDSDSDGINDRDDFCPRTKTGVSVDSIGCSVAQLTDSDNDGVSDSDDECPDTSNDGIPDRKGCSGNQRDVDGDGIVDELDECPLVAQNNCPRVIFWNTSTPAIEDTSQFRDIEISSDGQYIAAFSYPDLYILDSEFQSIDIVQSTSYYNSITEIEWSPVENKLLIFTGDYYDDVCTYQIWDGTTQALSEEFDTGEDCSQIIDETLRFSPDGTTFAFTTFSWTNYRTVTSVKDFSTHLTLLEDRNFRIDHLEYSNDGSTLIGGDGSQLVMWDLIEYEFVNSKRAQSTERFYLTPDANYIVTTYDENLYFYKTSNFELSNSIRLTTNESEITDITFSRSGDLMYATIMVGFCSWGCEEGSGALTKLQSYNLDGDELALLRSSEIINSGNVLVPVYHPQEQFAYVKLYTQDNYSQWLPDSDGDGFSDNVDQCPGTSIDVEVDENGCGGDQLDDDGDGLANFEDLCPDSPSGIATDENGCTDQQVDEDFDGICNEDALSDGPSNCVGEDECPQSANGIAVDNYGCSWAQQDHDSDGVNNADDECPDTEIPGDADQDGCDRKQRDTDGDSIKDYWDDCESTRQGDVIDEFGCSDLQVDADLDSVCNLDAVSSGPSNCTLEDRCPNTGVNESVDENGCSWNQKDDDGDGVFNKFDLCPNTLADSVSPSGCSTWQTDTDGDGVYDENDECANTNPEHVADSKGCSSQQNQLIESASDNDFVNTPVLIGAGVLLVAVVALLMFRKKGPEKLSEPSDIEYPAYETRGAMQDGREYIEHPVGSQQWFYRDPTTMQWVRNE